MYGYTINNPLKYTDNDGNQPATQMTYVQYDSLGRVLKSQQTTGTQAFPFTYIYNDQGLDTEIYPSGRKVETCYDPAGRVKQFGNKHG